MSDFYQGTLSIDGIISNLKTSELIAKLMTIERRPIDALKNTQKEYNNKLTAWQETNARFLALKGMIASLKYPITFETKQATSSNKSVLTASANTDATTGSYSINVTQIATAHSLSSDAQDIDDEATPLLTKFSLPAPQTFTITVNGANTNITVDADDTLADLKDKINTSGAAVTAKIVDDTPTTQKLIITSNNTGAANEISFTDSADELLLELGILSPPWQTVFSDDFEDGNILDWTIRAGTWSAFNEGANYVLRQSNAAAAPAVIHNGNTSWTDYEYTGRVRAQRTGALKQWAFRVRVDNKNITDRGVDIGYLGDTNRVFAYNRNGSYFIQSPIPANGNYQDTTWHNVRVTVEGQTYSFWIDNNLQFSVIDTGPSQIPNGAIGLRTFQEAADFDDVVVQIQTGIGIKNELVAAQDAQFTVDGLDITRPSNIVDDVIDGVTLNLISAGSATVSVTSDTENITTTINNFVTQYNNIIKFFKDQFYYDADTKKSGTLFGDSTLLLIQKTLQDTLFSQVDPRLQTEIVGTGDGVTSVFNLDNEITSLSDIKSILVNNVPWTFGGTGTGAGSYGNYVEVSLNGQLTFYKNGVQTPVENAKVIKANYAPAEKVNIQGIRYNLAKTINSISNITRITALYGGDTRNFTVRGINGISGNGYEVEINTSSSSSNGELKFYENGTLIPEASLSNVKASYVSSSALSSITQIGITTHSNQDTTLKVNTSILSSALANNLTGVKELFSKSSESIALKLDSYLATLTEISSGTIDITISGIQNSIDSITDKISKLEEIMQTREARYRKMFYDMEKALGVMQSQSTWLTQQINRLPSSWLLTPRSTSS